MFATINVDVVELILSLLNEDDALRLACTCRSLRPPSMRRALSRLTIRGTYKENDRIQSFCDYLLADPSTQPPKLRSLRIQDVWKRDNLVPAFSSLAAVLRRAPSLRELYIARQVKFVIDACMWASKHDNRDVEGAGLNMCLELVTNIAEKTDVQTSNAFFQQFFSSILQDVFYVLADPDHKAGFKTQSVLLMRMFYFVAPADGTAPRINGPVYTDQAQAGTTNKDFLSNFVGQLLRGAFPNLQV